MLELITALLILLLLTRPIILIPTIIVIILIYYLKIKKYNKSSYYKITKASYFNIKFDKGKYGEYLIYKYLMGLEHQGAKYLFNIYVPKNDEETTEIDVLMISHKGLFVFESKNYSGWIFGSEFQKYWYQTLPTGRRNRSHKEKFYNPIYQNNTHIKYLNSLIGTNYPTYSIITFSERCTLRNIEVKTPNVYVINRYHVRDLIALIYENKPDILTDQEITEIYNVLYPLTQVDENIKQKHIDNINNKFKNNYIFSNTLDNSNVSISTLINNNEPIIVEPEIIEKPQSSENINKEELICPLCGAKLELKTARYKTHAGQKFYGCSNYPKCKYIDNRNISNTL